MSLSFREGIEAQPENLRRGAEAVREALGEIDLARLREGTVVFSGIGASWHALLPTVRALRRAGRRAFAVPAPELGAHPGLGDAYVLVSQSGRSSEVLSALDGLDCATVYAVSAHADRPLAAAASALLPLGPLADTPVSTLSYTATLQTLGLLCEAIVERDLCDWPALAELTRETIERHDQGAAELAGRLTSVANVDAVGAAGAVASAGETALLAREALRLAASAEETRQYLHGPLEAVDESFGCILFGAERELQLASSLASFGATVCTVGERSGQVSPGVHAFTLPPPAS